MDKTLWKGLKLLEALAHSDAPRGVTSVAQELDLSKSNTHRLLQTLAALGYVDASDGRYFATPKIWTLGEKIVGRLAVRKLAIPAMQALSGRTRETVHLSILDQADVIFVDKIDSLQPIRAYTEVGGRAPACAVASGKALLAYRDPALLEALVVPTLLPHTALTLADAQALREELATIRQQGYAVNRGEWREQIRGVAAPVFDRHGQAIAAIGIAGPADRLTLKRMHGYAPLVCDAAQRVSQQLGAAG